MRPEIETFTGRFVDPLNVMTKDVCLEDVAHALSMKTRFTGHGKRFCSIAQHCVNVSKLVPMHLRMAALFHEGDEVYGPDISSPLKQSGVFDEYKIAARQAANAVYDKFKCGYITIRDRSVIKHADTVMLSVEAEQNLSGYRNSEQWRWVREYADRHSDKVSKARDFRISSPPLLAEEQFIARYQQILLESKV